MAALSTRQALISGTWAAPCASPSAGNAASGNRVSFVCGRRNADSRDRLPIFTSQFRGLAFRAIASSSSVSPQNQFKSRSPALSPRSALVQKVTAKELDSILTNERTSPMIIDFYATWCGPCVVLAQQLETLALEYGEIVRFLKVDTDEEHELAAQMEIRGLPTMVFVSQDVDKLAIRTEGLLPIPTIRDIIEKEL